MAVHQEMVSFLPSEIARLVYGYLEEEECTEAAQAFLSTSMHLKECLTAAKKGRKFSTKIYGYSLVDLFDLLSESISYVKENVKTFKEGTNMSSRLLSLLQSDAVIINNNTETSDEPATTKDKIASDPENQQTNLPRSSNSKNDSPSSVDNDAEYREVSSILYPKQSLHINETDEYSPHFIKIKEENDIEENGFEMEESHEDEEAMPSIEPEVQILSPDGHLRQDLQPPLNVITNPHPIMVGRAPQLLCQPYGMVHMVPAFPAPAHPNLSTTLFMPQQGISTPQHPITVHHSQAIIQTSGSAVSSPSSSSNQTVWPKPKATTQQGHQAPILKGYKRTSDSREFQFGNKDKMSKLKQGIYQASSKLRPIAPKITQSLDNGVRVQVVHTKENPLIEGNQGITKRSLRVRRKNNSKKARNTAAPLFIDIQEMCNDN